MSDSTSVHGAMYSSNLYNYSTDMLIRTRCPMCGKIFSRTEQHVYKIALEKQAGRKQRHQYFCSYTCFRAAQKAKIEDVKATGKSIHTGECKICGKPVTGRYIYCIECKVALEEKRKAERSNELHKIRLAEFNENGTCVRCGKRQARPGKRTCEECARRMREAEARNRNKKNWQEKEMED